MDNKKLVGKLVDHYWELTDTIELLQWNGNITPEELVSLTNMRLNVDELLRNVSKRWAKGKRSRDYAHTRLSSL